MGRKRPLQSTSGTPNTLSPDSPPFGCAEACIIWHRPTIRHSCGGHASLWAGSAASDGSSPLTVHCIAIRHRRTRHFQLQTRVPVQEHVSSGTGVNSDIPVVGMHHFGQALLRVAPSVSRKDERLYDALRSQLRSSRGHLNPQVIIQTM